MFQRLVSLQIVFSVFLSLSHADELKVPPAPILDLKAMNPKIDPCSDFYLYSCGKWIEGVKLPSDKASYFRQWSGLEDQTDLELNQILKHYAAGDFTLKTKYAGKIGDYYAACLQAGKAPVSHQSRAELAPYLDQIENMNSPSDLAHVIGRLHQIGVNALFSFGSGQDVNDSTTVTAFFDQGGMGLPDRDYYLKTDLASLKILKDYTNHIAKVFRLSGIVGMTAAKSLVAAQSVVAFEKSLAEKALPLDDRRDPAKTNNPMLTAGLKKNAPGFSLDSYLEAMGVPTLPRLILMEPLFYQNLSAILTTLNFAAKDQLKNYLDWQLLLKSSENLGRDFEREHFHFWGNQLRGKKTVEPRWKVCTHQVGDLIRDALGEAYVSRNSGAEPKKRTSLMIDQIKQTFENNLDGLMWLDGATRSAALVKLGKLHKKLGYPDVWKNYDSLQISSKRPLLNQLLATQFATRFDVGKIGKPVDRSEWQMAPWEQNAYYDSSMNEFVFPLGELLPPVLDLKASDGANFGALGATIGHELTHGYDDQGRHFDASGNLVDWWTKVVQAKFEEKSACYIGQAGSYPISLGSGKTGGILNVNGKATLGENLADQGGTKLAYLAFKTLASQRGPIPEFGGFNETQQFFITYAQSWCGKMTPEALRVQLSSDFHPPSEFRVNAVMMNMPAFAASFSCKERSPMAPKERCSLW